MGGTARPTDRQLVPLQLQPTSQVHAAGCSVVPPDGNTSHSSEKTSSREVLLMNTSHPSEKTSSREVLSMNTSSLNDRYTPTGMGCIIVEATVCGLPCRVLLDTGATHCHISEHFARKHALNVEQMARGYSVTLANSSVQQIHTWIPTADLVLNGTSEKVELVVMPLPAHYDVILGMQWHRAHQPVTYSNASVQYQTDRGRVTLQQPIAVVKELESNCLISASQLRRMLRKPIRGSDNTPPSAILETYLVYVNAVDTSTPVASDKYATYFMEKYPTVCSDQPTGLPPHRSFDHHIELEPGAEAPNKPAYRQSSAHNDELKKQLTALLDLGVIRPSKSPFASPVLFVKKQDGSWRLCIDYRALNRVTKKNRYPLPHQDDLIERLRHARYLTKLDLRSGYWQVRMGDDSVEKTAFTTRYGLYEWLVMPFGLCNAPSTFMQMMNDLLRPLLDSCVAVFIDDVIIWSTTEQQHYKDVTAVFDILQQNQLAVKMSKCDFFKEEVTFLGHVVGRGSVRMCPDKLAAIVEWPTPHTTTDVRAFLGLCGYYRKFVKGFSSIAKPLYELTSGDAVIQWTPAAEQSFTDLKHALTTAPVLALPDHEKPWSMFTDASGYGIGGVLCQDHGNGPQPVLFVSHKLSGAELNWPVHDKEMYAVIYMFKTCRWYVQDRHVTVYTDHKALEYFATQPTLSPRQTRWQQYLASYDWTIVYKAGKYNVVADGLSRRSDMQVASVESPDSLPLGGLSLECASGTFTTHTDDTWLREVQQGYNDDPWCKAILDSNGTPIYTVQQCEDGPYIYRGTQMVIPNFDAAKLPLLQEAHDATAAGHRGAMATHHRISRHYYWPRMYQEIVTYCKECLSCQQSKNLTLRPGGLLMPLPVPEAPGDAISIDFITKLPKTERGHTGILTVIDRLTKYVVLIPTSTKDDHSNALAHENNELNTKGDVPAAEITCDLLFHHWVKHFGVPRTITSDRDPQFVGEVFTSTFQIWGTKLQPTTAYHPEGDGQTERTHRTIEEVMGTLVSEQQHTWDLYLAHTAIAINTAPSASTGQTPHHAVFGREMRTPLNMPVERAAPTTASRAQSYAERVTEIRDRMTAAQNNQKFYADQKRRAEMFHEGDYAFVTTKHLRAPTDRSNKLKLKYAGPYKIVKKINDVTFELELHQVQSVKQPERKFHVSKLRRFYPRFLRFVDSDKVDEVPQPPILIDEDVEYEVEEVLDKRVVKGKPEYLIRWQGYSKYHDTWEPKDHLQNAEELVAAYHRLHDRSKKKKESVTTPITSPLEEIEIVSPGPAPVPVPAVVQVPVAVPEPPSPVRSTANEQPRRSNRTRTTRDPGFFVSDLASCMHIPWVQLF